MKRKEFNLLLGLLLIVLCLFSGCKSTKKVGKTTDTDGVKTQKEFFTDTAWKAYYNALISNATNLLNPSATTSQSTINSAANTLREQTAKLAAAVTATTETYTYSYKKVVPLKFK